jgi:hypothetical protein
MAGWPACHVLLRSHFGQALLWMMKMSRSWHRYRGTELERMDFTSIMYNMYNQYQYHGQWALLYPLHDTRAKLGTDGEATEEHRLLFAELFCQVQPMERTKLARHWELQTRNCVKPHICFASTEPNIPEPCSRS